MAPQERESVGYGSTVYVGRAVMVEDGAAVALGGWGV